MLKNIAKLQNWKLTFWKSWATKIQTPDSEYLLFQEEQGKHRYFLIATNYFPFSLCVRMLDWFDYHGHMCIAFEMLGLSVFDFLVSTCYESRNRAKIKSVFADPTYRIEYSARAVHDIVVIFKISPLSSAPP